MGFGVSRGWVLHEKNTYCNTLYETGRERIRGFCWGLQGYKVFSRDIRYMEAQDPLWRVGSTVVCLRWSLTSLVDLSFVGRVGGLKLGRQWVGHLFTSPCGGWMRPPPPPPFLSFVLGSVAKLRTTKCRM